MIDNDKIDIILPLSEYMVPKIILIWERDACKQKILQQESEEGEELEG